VSDTAYGGPIVTGEAVAVELRPAGIGSRGIALIIDLVVQYATLFGLILVATNVMGGADEAVIETFVIVSLVVVMVGYPVGFESLWRGRTLGKAAMGLRVVRDDGGPVRFRHAFVRGLVGVVLDKPGISWGLLAAGPMLMTARSKRLGDLAAGTVVVQERVPSRLAAAAVMPPPLAAWAASIDLSLVDDPLAMELRQFLGRSAQLAPWAREQMGTRLLSELSRRTAPPPPTTPPWAYFSAVLAERTRREMQRAAPAQLPPTAPRPPAANPSTDFFTSDTANNAPSPEPSPESPPGPFAPPA
jgi:uncharacterized RDD family membrane protein YckC